MRRAITIAVCVLIGAPAGYFAAPIASMWFVQSREPDMFGAFFFSLVDSSVACNCSNQPPGESLKTLTSDLSVLQRWRAQYPDSRMLAQEIGLTEIRESRLERELGHDRQADDDMTHGRAELTALGWQDVSDAHLIALITQLNSEYKSVDQKKNAAAVTP